MKTARIGGVVASIALLASSLAGCDSGQGGVTEEQTVGWSSQASATPQASAAPSATSDPATPAPPAPPAVDTINLVDVSFTDSNWSALSNMTAAEWKAIAEALPYDIRIPSSFSYFGAYDSMAGLQQQGTTHGISAEGNGVSFLLCEADGYEVRADNGLGDCDEFEHRTIWIGVNTNPLGPFEDETSFEFSAYGVFSESESELDFAKEYEFEPTGGPTIDVPIQFGPVSLIGTEATGFSGFEWWHAHTYFQDPSGRGVLIRVQMLSKEETETLLSQVSIRAK